jgi:hypothetical protein
MYPFQDGKYIVPLKIDGVEVMSLPALNFHFKLKFLIVLRLILCSLLAYLLLYMSPPWFNQFCVVEFMLLGLS